MASPSPATNSTSPPPPPPPSPSPPPPPPPPPASPPPTSPPPPPPPVSSPPTSPPPPPPPVSSPPTSPPPPPSPPSSPPPPPPAPSGTTPPPPPSSGHHSPPPPPPPSGHNATGGGGKPHGSGNSWSINGISSNTVVVGIVIGGMVLLLVATVICVCCSRKKRKRRDNYDGSQGYYVPSSLPHSVPPQEGYYGGPVQHWQQDYAYSPPLPPKPPSPPPTMPPRPPRPPSFSPSLGSAPSVSSRPGSWSESLFPPSSPGYSCTFSYDELAVATDYFSDANMLGSGKGHSGYVHKGILHNGKEIAVKSLNNYGNGSGEQKFQTEVEIIGRVHHKHLVSLVGYCITGSHWFLVYQFVPNRTLDFHLHGEGQSTMDWPTRLRIALGTAKGLAYLHEDCHPTIIHGNIKSANILLDYKFEAKVADFGRAKVSPDGNTHVSTRVLGTIGYMAPEYAATGKLSDKSDVFSFGVVLLELITGRPPVNAAHRSMNDSFVEWARPLLKQFLAEREVDSLVDPRLQNKYDSSEMARMIVCAAACVRQSAQRRPRMSQVVRALEGELSLTDDIEAIRHEQSTTYTFESSDNDSNPRYIEDMKRDWRLAVMRHNNNNNGGSSEYDGTTSEYGLYPSGSSSEIPSFDMTPVMERKGR